MERRDQVPNQLRLARNVSERFGTLAAVAGTSRSSMLAAAIAAFLDRRGASGIEERFAFRLDRISNRPEWIWRSDRAGDQSLCLVIRYMLTFGRSLPEEDEAARGIGHDRFAAVVARVGRRPGSGRRTAKRDVANDRG